MLQRVGEHTYFASFLLLQQLMEDVHSSQLLLSEKDYLPLKARQCLLQDPLLLLLLRGSQLEWLQGIVNHGINSLGLFGGRTRMTLSIRFE